MKVITIAREASWLKWQLYMRHGATSVTFNSECTELYVTVKGKTVTVPYAQIKEEANKLHTCHAIEQEMALNMLLLLATEGLAELDYTYHPSKEFIQFWDNTYGRTT